MYVKENKKYKKNKTMVDDELMQPKRLVLHMHARTEWTEITEIPCDWFAL